MAQCSNGYVTETAAKLLVVRSHRGNEKATNGYCAVTGMKFLQ